MHKKIYQVQLGEKYYFVTSGGYCWLRGVEIIERRKLITDFYHLHWSDGLKVYNCQQTVELMGRK